jgi:hypothetical protein
MFILRSKVARFFKCSLNHESIEETNDEEIAKAIRSINRGKSADYHGLTIEHIINAGKDITTMS